METKPTPPTIEAIRERLEEWRTSGRIRAASKPNFAADHRYALALGELHDHAPADIAALLKTVDAQAAEIERLRNGGCDLIGSWCPQCGYGVACDEDGCCAHCGVDAVGTGADQAIRLRTLCVELAGALKKVTNRLLSAGIEIDASKSPFPTETAQEIYEYFCLGNMVTLGRAALAKAREAGLLEENPNG